MSEGQRSTLLAYLRRLVGTAATGDSDAELLERFAAQRDETAFEALPGWNRRGMLASFRERADRRVRSTPTVHTQELAIKGSVLFDGFVNPFVNPCREGDRIRVTGANDDSLVFLTLIVQSDEVYSVERQYRPINVLR